MKPTREELEGLLAEAETSAKITWPDATDEQLADAQIYDFLARLLRALTDERKG